MFFLNIRKRSIFLSLFQIMLLFLLFMLCVSILCQHICSCFQFKIMLFFPKRSCQKCRLAAVLIPWAGDTKVCTVVGAVWDCAPTRWILYMCQTGSLQTGENCRIESSVSSLSLNLCFIIYRWLTIYPPTFGLVHVNIQLLITLNYVLHSTAPRICVRTWML